MVMMGHLHIPALDSAVSSISYPIVTGLLKEELGFDGIVVTDALTMKGVSENLEPAEIALAAYNAGVDILLKPGDILASIDCLEKAITAGGKEAIEDLDNRVRKVLKIKAEFGMLEKKYSAQVDTTNISNRVKKAEHIALTQELSDKTMTLLDNKSGLIPLDASKRIAYVAYNAKHIPLRREYGDIEGLSGYNPATGMVDSTTLMYQHLLRQLGNGATSEVHYFALDKKSSKKEIAAVEKHLKEYDIVLLACHDPRGRSRKDMIHPDHLAALEKLVKKHQPILVHFGSPYGLAELPWLNELGGILVCYQDSESNQRAAAKVLTGEIIAEGILPVSIEK